MGKDLLDPSHAIFQPISNRGSIPANHMAGGREGGDGYGKVEFKNHFSFYRNN